MPRLVSLIGLWVLLSLARAEPATFHFVNIFPGDSVALNATVESPSSGNAVITNIPFGSSHQPIALASGTLGQGIVTTTTKGSYICTVPIEVAQSMGPGLANIVACAGTSVLSCSALWPSGEPSGLPYDTTYRVLHASLSLRSKVLSFQWKAGTFTPDVLANATFGVCGSWQGANLEDWNGNSTLFATASSHGVVSTVASLPDFNSQSGAVVTFVIADDEKEKPQIFAIIEGFSTMTIPLPTLGAEQDILRINIRR